ncbi:hypothetical protein F5H01DRAFT_355675, partial [Linnemannia elongata]
MTLLLVKGREGADERMNDCCKSVKQRGSKRDPFFFVLFVLVMDWACVLLARFVCLGMDLVSILLVLVMTCEHVTGQTVDLFDTATHTSIHARRPVGRGHTSATLKRAFFCYDCFAFVFVGLWLRLSADVDEKGTVWMYFRQWRGNEMVNEQWQG